jgi:hypothetical protein
VQSGSGSEQPGEGERKSRGRHGVEVRPEVSAVGTQRPNVVPLLYKVGEVHVDCCCCA